jgi:hypothetical protein
MMSVPDLQLQYMVANKEPVTPEVLEALILRAFAHHFCDVGNEDTAGTIISQLCGCLCTIQLGEAYEESEEKENEVEARILHGPAAEKCYRDEIIRLYRERGFDQLYAEESADWPDVLPMSAEYLEETLHKMAALEVGHDLIVIDYLRATAAHRQAAESKLGRTK